MVEAALDFPIYSIKAVAHMAGVTEPTLRAWEKRYSILTPQRTESGHRRYTRRDIYRVIWLKSRLEEGMSISQASLLLQTLPENNLMDHIQTELKPSRNGNGKNNNSQNSNGHLSHTSQVRSISALIDELLDSLVDFDEAKSDQLLSEAMGLYSPETVCTEIMQPVLVEIGERWMRNEVTVATEHFASNLCRTRLNAMLESLPVVKNGPLILTACGPHEFHEIGVIITTLFLRRHGWRVLYLGQNVPSIDLEKDLRRLKPSLIVFSAGRTETALSLAKDIKPVIEKVRTDWLPNLIFGYGGRAFMEEPSLHELFVGHIYFGDDAEQSVSLTDQILHKN